MRLDSNKIINLFNKSEYHIIKNVIINREKLLIFENLYL